MKGTKIQHCKNYKSLDQHSGMPIRQQNSNDCKQCVYFSSRNCGMDVAESIEPVIDILS